MANPDAVKRILAEMERPKSITDSDLELIKVLCLPYKIICLELELSQEALRIRIFRLMGKMGVENRTALVVKAVQLGLISISELKMRKFNGTNTS